MARPRNIKINLLKMAVLLYNVYKGAANKNVGFEDADNTLNNLVRTLSPEMYISAEDLESALWSCNLLDERGEFWHPLDHSFDEFSKSVLKNHKFDKSYNLIKE